jgi:hypothetical protein
MDFVMSEILEADILRSWDGTADDGQGCEYLSGWAYPLGQAGDAVFRRLYLSLEWFNGVSLTLTPIVDDELLTEFSQVFTRTGAGREEVELKMKARGARIALQVVTTEPTGEFYIDTNAFVAVIPGRPVRK